MLKDTELNYFVEIYIICGYTDLCYGSDLPTAIIGRKYKVKFIIPNTRFFSATVKLCKRDCS